MSAADRNKQVTGSPKAGGLELERRTCCVPVKPPRLAGQARHRRHVLGRGRDRETREGPFILCVARCALHSRVRCGGATTFSRVSAKSSCRWRMAAWMKFQGRPWCMCRGINTVLPLRSALKNSISSSILNIHIRHVFTLGFCTYLFGVPLNLLCAYFSLLNLLFKA